MPDQRQHRLAIGVARLDLQLELVELDARAVGRADIDVDEGRRVLPIHAVEAARIGGDLAGSVPGRVHVVGDRVDRDILVAHQMLVLHVRLLRHALVDDDADVDLAGVAATRLRLEQAADRGVGERVGPRAADLLAVLPLRFVDRAAGQPRLADAVLQAIAELALEYLAGAGKQASLAIGDAGDEHALVAIAVGVDMDALALEKAVRPAAVEHLAGADLETAVAVRPAVAHLAGIDAVDGLRIVAGRTAHPPDQLALAVDRAVRGDARIGARCRFPDEIELLFGMRIPDPDLLPDDRAGLAEIDHLDAFGPGAAVPSDAPA